MKATVLGKEKNEVSLSVEAGKEEVGKEIKKTYARLAREVKIPGFRKGKVPPLVLRSHLGVETIYHEALKELLPVFYNQAVKELNLKPITQPQFDVKTIGEEEGLVFNAKVEVKPEVKLGSYKGIEVETLDIEVKEEEINEQLEMLRERFAQLKVASGRPIKEGDFALVSFQGLIDGRVLESASAEDFMFEVGKGQFIPEFEENLLGAKVGEVREFDVDFPPEYPLKEVAEKKVHFKVIVKEIKEKELPPLDDEFAKQAGAFGTLDELKGMLKERLEEVKKREAEMSLRNEVMRKVVAEAEVELPETLVNQELEEVLAEFAYRLSLQGVSIPQYLDRTNKSLDDLKGDLRPEAEKRLKNELVLEAIAEKEKLTISDEELRKQIELLAEKSGKKADELSKEMEQKGQLELLKYDMILKKSLDFIVDKAKKVEKGA